MLRRVDMDEHQIEGMNFKQSLLFFGIPGLLICFNSEFLVPRAVNGGVSLIVASFVGIWGPIILLFILVSWPLFRFSLAGPLDSSRGLLIRLVSASGKSSLSFKEYFNLKPLCGNAWWWVIGGLILAQSLEVVLAPSAKLLARLPFFTPPAILPEIFNPFFDPAAGLTHFMGESVKGNWWLVPFWFLWLIVNIGGEELLWRGYALPRQKKVFGQWAWLVNGLLWNLLVHLFFRWNFITLLPITLIVPYLSQKLDSTWPGIILHGTGNLLVLVILIPAIVS